METRAGEPAFIAHGGDMDDQLRSVTAAVKHAYNALEDLITHPDGRGAQLVRPTPSASRAWPSWNSRAAFLVFDLDRLTRDHEHRLRTLVSGTTLVRGGSTRNTFLSLDALVALGAAVGADDVHDTLTALSRWRWRASEALGEIEPLSRLPRLPGQQEPRCPWCERMTLRQQPYAGLVRCINPACRDTDGRRPVGRVELGRLSCEPLLVWGTGEVGL